ncbi:MATE family efflux transporter [Pseudobacteriovorax antillogorgiicola]|uniref:Multidrug-efflux transporter n=1 Tax=Pseudobacteriovorax antillogorgiicola TaxID=1513793 RepID=A0A1Y6C5Y5_9BACT|nr:MATE family efflux transporter [Pseudobacteriovorax antillogorgiicola]TCS49388.1 putative MATE family efflux protein [Pseudobacteriovorax antillogorgiicola]SMF47214.1 putative efflux protein, MATE family [Pseudobacteriovorax antillogorgiicola]
MESQRFKKIMGLSLPIMGGMVSQNVTNLVDIFFVKNLGSAALAAVGLGGFAAFVSISLVLGVSTGVQAIAARRKGEGEFTKLAQPLNTGLLIALVSGIALAVPLFILVPHFYPYLNSDPEVIDLGSSYLQIRLLGIVFVGLNFSFRGYWNGINLSKLYMGTLVFMHLINIFLNYALIFGNFGFPQLGLDGAAWGTSISFACGTLVYLSLGMRHARHAGFLRIWPSWDQIKQMLTLSLPSGVQQLFFSSGLLAFFWIVGLVGTTELAAANILTNVMLVAILPAMGLGLAAASLVGQALGRQDAEDARLWAWDVVKVGILIIGTIGLPMWAVPDWVLLPFAPGPEAMAASRLPLRITGAYIALDSVGLVLMNALLGAGASKQVMAVSLSLQWILFLPLALLAVSLLGAGFTTLWVMQGTYRLFQAIVFIVIWERGSWASIKL